jgi:hypothetical protein
MGSPSGAAGIDGAGITDGEDSEAELSDASAVVGSLGQTGFPSED